jgi:hypothetical protein
VDDADLKDAAPLAFHEIFRDQVLDLPGMKGVEVQNPVDREFDRIQGSLILVH